ncbi:MAG TPA: hypothetical protein VI039_10000 [Solirubrobacterales bacterium]
MFSIKKLLLLCGTALAIGAFTAPAASADEVWTTGGKKIGDVFELNTVGFKGELSFKQGSFTVGPGGVEGHGRIWNGAAMGEGVIEKFSVNGELPVGPKLPASCKATIASEATPWKVTLTTGVVDIEAAVITSYNAACQALGFPAAVTASGTVTAPVTGPCMTMENAGDLKTTGGAAVLITGMLCLTDTNEAEEETEEGTIGTE